MQYQAEPPARYDINFCSFAPWLSRGRYAPACLVDGGVVGVPSTGAGHDLAYSRGGWFFLGVPRGQDWPCSSANAHSLGHDADHLLTFDLWRHIFGNPDTIIDDWLPYIMKPATVDFVAAPSASSMSAPPKNDLRNRHQDSSSCPVIIVIAFRAYGGPRQ